MNAILMILSLLTALLPLADRGMQYAQQRQVQQQQPQPPQQPGVVFHNGQWWKYDGQRWWVWAPNNQAQLLAQGGTNVYR